MQVHFGTDSSTCYCPDQQPDLDTPVSDSAGPGDRFQQLYRVRG